MRLFSRRIRAMLEARNCIELLARLRGEHQSSSGVQVGVAVNVAGSVHATSEEGARPHDRGARDLTFRSGARCMNATMRRMARAWLQLPSSRKIILSQDLSVGTCWCKTCCVRGRWKLFVVRLARKRLRTTSFASRQGQVKSDSGKLNAEVIYRPR